MSITGREGTTPESNPRPEQQVDAASCLAGEPRKRGGLVLHILAISLGILGSLGSAALGLAWDSRAAEMKEDLAMGRFFNSLFTPAEDPDPQERARTERINGRLERMLKATPVLIAAAPLALAGVVFAVMGRPGCAASLFLLAGVGPWLVAGMGFNSFLFDMLLLTGSLSVAAVISGVATLRARGKSLEAARKPSGKSQLGWPILVAGVLTLAYSLFVVVVSLAPPPDAPFPAKFRSLQEELRPQRGSPR
jgi:hypothetical protein